MRSPRLVAPTESPAYRAIFSRNVWTVGVLLALLTLLGAGLSIWDIRRKAMDDATTDVRNLGGVLAEETLRQVQLIDVLLQEVQSRTQNLGIRSQDEFRWRLGDAATHQALGDLMKNLHQPRAISLFDADGTLLNRSGSLPPTRVSIADSDLFQHLRLNADSGMFVSQPVKRHGGAMAIFLGRRIIGRDGEFLGAVTAVIDLDYLLALYRKVTRDGVFGVTLLRRDGVVLARFPQIDAVGRVMPAVSPWYALVAAGGGTYRTSGFLGGTKAIISANPLAGYPLVLDVSNHEEDVLAVWRSQAAYTGAGAAMLAGACLALFWMIGRQIRQQEAHSAALANTAQALRSSEGQLRDNEAHLDRAQEIAGIGSWELDVASDRLMCSRQLYRIAGLPPDVQPTRETIATCVHPDDAPTVSEWFANLQAGRQQGPIEARLHRPDGSDGVVRVEGRALAGPGGLIRRLAGTMQDITERQLIERQLAQAQKMEAIGGLTGGMAHDFNNVLCVIIGNLKLLWPLIKTNAAASELCGEALDGASRCAELIRSLLAFSRRQSLCPSRIDVNAQVKAVAHLLGRTLGQDIALNLHLAEELWPVTADPAQLEAALINLMTNARDAMPKGGDITIVTRNTQIDAAHAAPDRAAGDYTQIEISDTGTGIPPDIIGRIFEPFFTTKGPGKGTGLGLSMALGFVQQSGGHLSAHSTPGSGATFRLCLPRSETGRTASATRSGTDDVAGGGETVLMVEDDVHLRRVAALQLAELGYHVREAEHAAAALTILHAPAQVDLLFTDVVMPGDMDGIDLANEAALLRPDLRVLLTSGFPDLRSAKPRLTGCRFPMLQKPYRLHDLARAIRNALDKKSDEVASDPI